MEALERSFEQERAKLKTQICELEEKLKNVMCDLTVVESTLTLRNEQFDALQNNLKELEELRELKEVSYTDVNLLSVAPFFLSFIIKYCRLTNPNDYLCDDRILIGKMNKQQPY